MIEVASLRYGVIFKKAFGVPEIFNAFVQDVVGVAIEVEEVEMEKSFSPVIGAVDVTFDLYAQDLKNRLIVDIQHERHGDHYDRFLHYACTAILEQVAKSDNYRPTLAVYTVVVLTSGDKHKKEIAVTDMEPKDRDGEGLGETPHKVIYLAPKYADERTPEPLREWLRAIDDSLDGVVDEESYTRPEIHRIFELIQKDLVTPQERAKMIEEHHQEEVKETSLQKGIEIGEKRGEKRGLELGKLQTQREILIDQLGRRFKDIPTAILSQIEETDDSMQLDVWLDAFWRVDTLEEMGF